MARLHQNHPHEHGPQCSHTGIRHEDHVDYLHDGCLHHPGNQGIEEHTIKVNSANPAECTPEHRCGAHEEGHRHGPGCGHEPVPHGDHTDYLVDGHLHHPHEGHCDDHGRLQAVQKA